MTTLPDDAPQRPRRLVASPQLPDLTPAVIQRARQGLEAARNERARHSAQVALSNADRLTEGQEDRHFSGWWRRNLLHLIIHSLFRVRVEHPEHMLSEPAVIAPTHLSHLDPFLVLAEIPARPYTHVIADARSLYNKAWKRAILNVVQGVLPLDRLWREESAVMQGAATGRADMAELAAAIASDVPDGGSIQALRRLERIIQSIFTHGDSLMIFPEGALVGAREGKLNLPLKRGTVLYALRAGVPIVPVGIIGAHDLYLRKTLTVRFGAAIRSEPIAHPRPRDIEAVLERLENGLQELITPPYHEPGGFKPLRYFFNHMLW